MKQMKHRAEKESMPKWQLLLPVAILLTITVLGSWYAALDRSTNGDALVFPYLYSGIFWHHNMVLASIHSNILKAPLFLLQAHLPYNFFSYSMVSIAVVVATLGIWVATVATTIGKRAAAVTALVLAYFLASSQEINLQLAYTTVRNLEFAIILLFAVLLVKAARSEDFVQRRPITTAMVVFLFSLGMAGDKFMLYVAAAPLAAIGALFIARKRRRSSFWPLSLVLISVATSFILKHAVVRLGIYTPDTLYAPFDGFVGPHTLWPSITATLHQLATLIGDGTFFNNWLVWLLGWGLALIGVLGLLKGVWEQRKRNANSSSQIVALSAVLMAANLAIYIGSKLAITVLPNGQIVSAVGNDRYITLVPLLLAIGAGYLLAELRKQIFTYVLIGFSFLVLITTALSWSHITAFRHNIDHRQASYKGLAHVLSANHINVMVSGYWYASTTNFWDHGQLHVAPVNSCNYPYVPNARLDWYTASPQVHRSAYLIDPVGPDQPFFSGCSTDKLRGIFGQPEKILTAPSYVDGKPLQIWVYNYDIRSKLVPASLLVK